MKRCGAPAEKRARPARSLRRAFPHPGTEHGRSRAHDTCCRGMKRSGVPAEKRARPARSLRRDFPHPGAEHGHSRAHDTCCRGVKRSGIPAEKRARPARSLRRDFPHPGTEHGRSRAHETRRCGLKRSGVRRQNLRRKKTRPAPAIFSAQKSGAETPPHGKSTPGSCQTTLFRGIRQRDVPRDLARTPFSAASGRGRAARSEHEKTCPCEQVFSSFNFR